MARLYRSPAYHRQVGEIGTYQDAHIMISVYLCIYQLVVIETTGHVVASRDGRSYFARYFFSVNMQTLLYFVTMVYITPNISPIMTGLQGRLK